jgi:hypothetical protein
MDHNEIETIEVTPLDFGDVIKLLNGTYIVQNINPHNVVEDDPLFPEIDAYAEANPDRVTFQQPPTLAEIKAAKWDEIGAAYKNFDRTATVETTLEFPIQIGQEHLVKLDGAIRFAEMVKAETIYITDANDITHYDVDLDDANQVLIEGMTAAEAAHQKKQTLRAAVTAAETAEEVEAISWDE